MSNEGNPPLILVRTWVSLLYSNESMEVKEHAAKMLTNTFGSIQAAAEFCLKNGIKVN